jgi:hypothetical protein
MDPENRTTSIPSYPYTPVAWNAPEVNSATADTGAGPTTTIMPPADDDGWRASNR